MKKIFTFLIAIVITSCCYCNNILFKLEGHIDRITSSVGIISLNIQGKKFTTRISKDGNFHLTGTIKKAGQAIIKTESGNISFVWIDDKPIEIQLYESKQKDQVFLLTKSVVGSDDAYLYYYNHELSRKMTGRTTEELEASEKAVIIPFLDSVFKVRPDSKVLPFYINLYANILGDSLVNKYYQFLSPEQKLSDAGISLAHSLAQLQVIDIGSYFNNFSMPDSEGKMVSLNSITSDYILIDFWASWCGPCRANHPFLAQLNKTYKEKGLSIISISLDENKKNWLNAMKKDNMIWLNLCDLKGYNGELAKQYKLHSIPWSVLLDKNRKVIAIDKAGNEWLDLMSKLLLE